MTSMVTWQADDAVGLEGARLVVGASGFRALGRMVHSGPRGELTASYRLVVGEDRIVQRLSVTAATGDRERHLTINRTEDGYWLLDDGSGSARSDFSGAIDIDLDRSPLFNALPIRRLGLHTEHADHTLPVVFVTLPYLTVEIVEKRYRTVSTLDEAGTSVITMGARDVDVDLVVDREGVVLSYPGLARRVPAPEPVGN